MGATWSSCKSRVYDMIQYQGQPRTAYIINPTTTVSSRIFGNLWLCFHKRNWLEIKGDCQNYFGEGNRPKKIKPRWLTTSCEEHLSNLLGMHCIRVTIHSTSLHLRLLFPSHLRNLQQFKHYANYSQRHQGPQHGQKLLHVFFDRVLTLTPSLYWHAFMCHL